MHVNPNGDHVWPAPKKRHQTRVTYFRQVLIGFQLLSLIYLEVNCSKVAKDLTTLQRCRCTTL